jgi:hypothetical protein
VLDTRDSGGEFMSAIRMCAVSTLVVAVLAGCAARPGDESLPRAADTDNAGPAMPADLRSVLDAATRDTVNRLNIDPATIAVESALLVTWSDGSVGCPVAGMQYTQALVPGYRVMLRAGGQLFDYHAAANGHLVLCPPERAIEPAQNDPI